MGQSLSTKAVVLGSLIYAIASRSYHRHNDDAESWLFVDENELNALQYYWDENLLWDKSDIITIHNGYTHIKYQIKCIHNKNGNLCACQRDNYAAIHKCQEYSSHQQTEGISAAASDMYYGSDDDSYSYVIGNELNDFADYWLYDDIWDTSDIIDIDDGYRTIDYQMKCINDINQYLCACRSFHNGPIYECEQISVDPYKGDKYGHPKHFKAKQEIANMLLMDNEFQYDYNTDLYLHFNKLDDFGVYWYDNDIWDTSDIITIDDGYKTTKYEIKCVKHGKTDLCACQSNHYGPIYECNNGLHHPYETEISDASTMDSNLIALHAADWIYPYQEITYQFKEFGEGTKEPKDYLHAVANILYLFKVTPKQFEVYQPRCSGVLIKHQRDAIDHAGYVLTNAHCIIDREKWIKDAGNIEDPEAEIENPNFGYPRKNLKELLVSFYQPHQSNAKNKKAQTSSSGNNNDEDDGKEENKNNEQMNDEEMVKIAAKMVEHNRVYYHVKDIISDMKFHKAWHDGKVISALDVALLVIEEVFPRDGEKATQEEKHALSKLKPLGWDYKAWEKLQDAHKKELFYAGYTQSSTLQVVKYRYLTASQSRIKNKNEDEIDDYKGMAMSIQAPLTSGHSGGPIYYVDTTSKTPSVVAVLVGSSTHKYTTEQRGHVAYREQRAVKLHETTLNGNLFNFYHANPNLHHKRTNKNAKIPESKQSKRRETDPEL